MIMQEKTRRPIPDTGPTSAPVEQEDWEGLKDVEFEAVYQNGEIGPKPARDKRGPKGSVDPDEAEATQPATRK
jgi:hypothetical protein